MRAARHTVTNDWEWRSESHQEETVLWIFPLWLPDRGTTMQEHTSQTEGKGTKKNTSQQLCQPNKADWHTHKHTPEEPPHASHFQFDRIHILMEAQERKRRQP